MDEFDLSTLSVRPGAHDRFTDDLGKLPHLTHVEYNAVGLVDLDLSIGYYKRAQVVSISTQSC